MIGVRPRTAGVGIPLHVRLFTCRFRCVRVFRKRGCRECKQNAEGKDRNETFHATSSFCWCCRPEDPKEKEPPAGSSLLLSIASPNPAPPGIPPPAGTAAPPPRTTGDEEAIVDEHATIIEVMVIHEVPVMEVSVIELPTGKSGATMKA